MKLRAALVSGIILLTLLIAAPRTKGQETTQGLDPCVSAFRSELARDERLFRTVIYGQPKAELARTGAVRFDKDGNSWLKTAPNTWQSLNPGYTGTQWSDSLMQQRQEYPDRVGLVEVRKTLTSEGFVEPATQALRALRCATAVTCERAQASEETAASFTIQPLGCLPVRTSPLPACKFGGRAPLSEREQALALCAQDRVASLALQAELLRMTGSYDSAIRSLYQFAGSFEGFLGDVRDPLLLPMQRTVNMFLELRRIPCFLSECNV